MVVDNKPKNKPNKTDRTDRNVVDPELINTRISAYDPNCSYASDYPFVKRINEINFKIDTGIDKFISFEHTQLDAKIINEKVTITDGKSGKIYEGFKLIIFKNGSKEVLTESIAFSYDTKDLWVDLNILNNFEADGLNGEHREIFDYVIGAATAGEMFAIPYSQQVGLFILSIQVLNELAGIEYEDINVEAGDYEVDVITYVNPDYTYPYSVKQYVTKEGNILKSEFESDNMYYIP